MSYLGNSPSQSTLLRVEARKSFSFGLWVTDTYGRAADLSGCTLRIVAKEAPLDNTNDDSNFLIDDTYASIATPTLGYARFDLQAASLDQEPGEYEYAIVLLTPEGYSSVIVKGTLDIQQNVEADSVNEAYSSVNPTDSITVMLQDSTTLNVFVGGQLPPGMNYVRDDVMSAIENFDPDSIALMPPGGTAGYVLTKTDNADYEVAWRPEGNGTFGLDATGQPSGYVPAAVGDDTWTWAAVGIDATGVTAGYAPVADGTDGWAWGEVTTAQSDWAATTGQPGEILNKPPLGTAAGHGEEDFVASDALVSEMTGVVITTSVPASGTDGYLYFVYTP